MPGMALWTCVLYCISLCVHEWTCCFHVSTDTPASGTARKSSSKTYSPSGVFSAGMISHVCGALIYNCNLYWIVAHCMHCYSVYVSHTVTLIACSDTPFDAEQLYSMRPKTGDSEGITTGMYSKLSSQIILYLYTVRQHCLWTSMLPCCFHVFYRFTELWSSKSTVPQEMSKWRHQYWYVLQWCSSVLIYMKGSDLTQSEVLEIWWIAQKCNEKLANPNPSANTTIGMSHDNKDNQQWQLTSTQLHTILLLQYMFCRLKTISRMLCHDIAYYHTTQVYETHFQDRYKLFQGGMAKVYKLHVVSRGVGGMLP